jgi:peroxiredoxin
MDQIQNPPSRAATNTAQASRVAARENRKSIVSCSAFMRLLLGFALLLTSILAVGCQSTSQKGNVAGDSSAVASPATAMPAPDFALKDLDGNTHKLSDYRGKVVVLNFWATWCPPCRAEIPGFVEEQKTLGPNVQFLGIALDDDGATSVKPWAASHGINYPVLLTDQSVTHDYGDINSIPATFYIDKQGRIRHAAIGAQEKDVLEANIKPLLAEK